MPIWIFRWRYETYDKVFFNFQYAQMNLIYPVFVIFFFFSFGQNLKYLELLYIDISSDWGLEQLTKLKSLEVLKMKPYKTFHVDNLIPFGNCKNLKELNVEINYTTFSPEKFSKFLENNRRPLKKLDFKKPQLSFNTPRSYFNYNHLENWNHSNVLTWSILSSRVIFCAFYFFANPIIRVVFLCLLFLCQLSDRGYFFVPSTLLLT